MMILIILVVVAMPLRVPAAVIAIDEFNTDDGLWSSRDPDEMSFVIQDGAMSGTFAAQEDEPAPETDAFRITGGPFVGDISPLGVTFWSFNFMALSMLPSDLIFRVNDGFNTFFKVLPVYNGLINVTIDGSWFGGDVSTALDSVAWIDLQITRNGEGAQTYSIDNFAMNSGDAPELTSAVPEPSSVSMLLFAAMMLIALRRSWNKSNEALT